MRFWLRELAGWILVSLGLGVFYICAVILINDPPLLLSSGPLTVIGIIIFRGGIHLLKVAVAARVCLHAHREITRQQVSMHTPRDEGARKSLLPLEW